MSSEEKTWPRGRTPPPALEARRSLTPPPTRGGAEAPRAQGESAPKEWFNYPPFPLGGKRGKQETKFGPYEDYGFAHFKGDFEDHLESLADMAMEENWKGKTAKGIVRNYDLLRNYLNYSFMFIEKETKTREKSTDGCWTAYDTRLISTWNKGVDPIYALFEKRTGDTIDEEWTFRGWYAGWFDVDKRSNFKFGGEGPPPYDPNVCQESGSLPTTWTHFNPKLTILYSVKHILDENKERLKDVVKAHSQELANIKPDDLDSIIAAKFEMAMKHATKEILNPRRVIPQLYFDKKKQVFRPNLLLPLHLMAQPAADLALTLQLENDPADPDNPDKRRYLARTVLTIDMAYNNARIFDSVESPWLRDTFAELVQVAEAATESMAESPLALEAERINNQDYVHEFIVANDETLLALAKA